MSTGTRPSTSKLRKKINVRDIELAILNKKFITQSLRQSDIFCPLTRPSWLYADKGSAEHDSNVIIKEKGCNPQSGWGGMQGRDLSDLRDVRFLHWFPRLTTAFVAPQLRYCDLCPFFQTHWDRAGVRVGDTMPGPRVEPSESSPTISAPSRKATRRAISHFIFLLSSYKVDVDSPSVGAYYGHATNWLACW